MRSGKEPRPVLCCLKDTDYHDRFLKWLKEDQVVAELRYNEPADLRVMRRGLADAPPQLSMLGEKVGGVEDDSPDAFRCFRIVPGDVTTMLVQIARGFGTEPGLDHDRRRNSSVVLD